ncbi:phytoene/squalene synthase family protein [Enterococcus plantarum]|uniref:Phytoene/squalene synthase family protein n=1 Tax=Enterococcus plantarum TaxID=1077675 RepID=A0A2W3ZE48_9ENTE|nr:phytoene/squalene synthase family protein [Enterococcus plantarum]PZL72304.1 phytoene/squalene synthase family protein [Enterococcus plantarum]
MIKRKDDVTKLFSMYESDFALCEETIRNHSKSFYKAFSKLPKQKALSIFAIYSFCREADDSIDVYRDVDRLNKLKRELDDFLAGKIPDRYFWRALVPVFETYEMNQHSFYDMLLGQEMDWTFQQPETQTELEEYSYYVAGSVGLMLLPILSDRPDEIRSQAIQLGEAMQITNILRDIGEDYNNQRIYLPKEIMERFDVSLDSLEKGIINDSFIELWEYEATRAEQLYSKAQTMLASIHKDCQEALLLSIYFYKGILNSVRQSNYQCFNKRNFVKKSQQLELYQKAKNYLKTL